MTGENSSLASKENQQSKSYFQSKKANSRLNITDRNGYILATNLEGVSVYIRPEEIQTKSDVAKKLANISSDWNEAELLNKLKDGRKFLWFKSLVSPKQEKALFDLGQPECFGKREYRFYPYGTLASHLVVIPK